MLQVNRYWFQIITLTGNLLKQQITPPQRTSTTEYEYDQNGQLKLLRTVTKADDDSEEITETHEYFYDEKGNL